MTPKLITTVVFVVAVVVAAGAVLVLSGGDDDGDGDTALASPTVPGTIVATFTPTAPPSATPTLETAPGVTPTPEMSPEEQARNLTLVEAPAGMLEFVTDGPYVVPGDALGVFYIDIETQQIEGWYDLIGQTHPIAFSGENRYTLFQRNEQAVAGGTIYPAGSYLGDRESRAVYRLPPGVEPVYEKTEFNGNELTARGDLVIFRVPVAGGDDWFSLLNITTGRVEATFEVEAFWALISRDRSAVAFLGESASIGDVDTGSIEVVGEGALDALGIAYQPGRRLEDWNVDFIETREGGGFVFAVTAGRPELNSVWQRYTWDGALEAEGTGAKVYVSPDGSLVAVAERIPVDAPLTPWHALTALNTADGSAVFRVVGVDERYGTADRNRWLADGSGIVTLGPGGRAAIAMHDGSFADYHGPPSPASKDRVAAIGGAPGFVGVADPEGNPLFQITFAGGVRDFVDAWGDNGNEIRVLIPHGGHDGGPPSATIVQPYIEEAPFDEQPEIQLSETAVAFGLLDLYDEPGSDTTVGEVVSPYRLTVLEVVQRCNGDGFIDAQACPPIESRAPANFVALVLGIEVGEDARLNSYWARVRTSNGLEGWLLMQANQRP